MEVLFSNVPPLMLGPDQKTIRDCIEHSLSQSDKIVFAVGYVSNSSLKELSRLVSKYGIQDITLIIGMYRSEGIPESLYNEIINLHEQWRKANIGNIFLVNNMTYHGKLYMFWKEGAPFSTIEGSANLSVLAPTGRQYEIGTLINDPAINDSFAKLIDDLKTKCTACADNLSEFKIIHERIELLNGIDSITEITDSSLESYQNDEMDIKVEILIKAPEFENRFSMEKNDYARSNINVCYGAGRKNSSNGNYDRRNWYETQLTVGKDIWSLTTYPKDKPFFVITDDGYHFQAHTTSANNKQFTAYDSDRIFGRWIKGRLVAAGLLTPVDDVDKDPEKLGVVTTEILKKANMEVLVLTKTTRKELGKVFNRKNNGRLDKSAWTYEPLDVWTIRFTKEEGEDNE